MYPTHRTATYIPADRKEMDCPMARAPWLHERKWSEIREYLNHDDVVLLPVGSTEQHGGALPLMTDAAEATAVAVGAGERCNVLVAPPLWYGWTPHHMGFPGTITLRPETLTAIVEDVCQSLFFHGFKRLLIINGHQVANLPPLEIAAVKVRNRTGGYVAIYDLGLSARVQLRSIVSGEVGAVGHAGENESSQMLYSHPDLVDMNQARRNVVGSASEFFTGGFNTPDPMQDNINFAYAPPTVEEFTERASPYSGAMGDATKGSAATGRLIHEAEVTNICKLVELSRTHEVKLKQFSIPI